MRRVTLIGHKITPVHLSNQNLRLWSGVFLPAILWFTFQFLSSKAMKLTFHSFLHDRLQTDLLQVLVPSCTIVSST
jgi:hypothetical protein